MKKDEKPGEMDRREFLTKTGAIIFLGAVTGLSACTPSLKKELEGIPIAAIIGHDPVVCAGCGVCGLMCSLYREKETSPTLARSEIVREPFEGVFSFNVCQQCRSPSCYLSCPLKDAALCIDEATGIKYVNPEKCDGCGKCTKACPFNPARIKVNAEKKVAYKCDLCREREEGPVCIQYCSQYALRIIPGNERV
jgi:Fe-S-cluster-containing hydrogenase component 2